MENRKKSPNAVVAICYDFDKTLSVQDMQNYGLISKLGWKVSDFWNASNAFAKTQKMDKILSYMKLIVEESEKARVHVSIGDFHNLGKSIKLFPGVDTWFDRINAFGQDQGVEIQHYIISAGLKEIIEGTSIAKYIKKVFASEFVYDDRSGWPV